MRKPQYFIENARNSESRHDKLTPHMSALIVQAHVKEGIDMAKAARLPKVITDMIPQHHGTRMISFFYEKAKEQEDPERQKIDPKDFKYPGPKPQTREAAILMLSDVAEAKVRALKEKSPARIEQAVRKIIDDVFREAQLDECDLTLQDLDAIHKAFVRILLGIYHQRIEYPDREKDKGEKQRENLGGGTNKASTSSDEDSLSVGIRGTPAGNQTQKSERNDRR
jgi:membrane-associated HD superfamily phosphohydrolase